MSSMLEQAIIDADQLKEAAEKSAQETVIEKYQDEIRSAVETILEQEEEIETDMDMTEEPAVDEAAGAEMMPDADGNLAFVEELPSAQKTDMDEIVTIDLDKLEEMMAEEMEDGTLNASDMAHREEIAEEIDAVLNEDDDEEVELDEDTLKEILGDIDVDLSPLYEDFVEDSTKEEDAEASEEEAEKAGGQVGAVYKGVSENTDNDDDEDDDLTPPEVAQEPKSQHPGELGPDETAYKRDSKKKKRKTGGEQYGGGGYYDYGARKKQLDENRVLVKEQKRTTQKVQLLEQKLNKYGTVIIKLKDKLEEGNLVNARLLYQNRVLNSISLNERQKDRIVEAISNAKSVEEAKIIFETLQSAVGSVFKKTRPESLNEAISRSSSAFISRKENTKKDSSFVDRMRTLAGITKE
jgi:hypothetical protein